MKIDLSGRSRAHSRAHWARTQDVIVPVWLWITREGKNLPPHAFGMERCHSQEDLSGPHLILLDLAWLSRRFAPGPSIYVNPARNTAG